jgi:FkbM family methyltransferase
MNNHLSLYIDKEKSMKNYKKLSIKAIKMLFSNPSGFLKKMKPYVFRAKSGLIIINGINFNIDLELDPAMRSMYFGSYQYEITDILERFLRKGDTFVDIGANIGYISAFALGLVGQSGEVHSFEPVPCYFARLKKIQQDNPEYNLLLTNFAVGEIKGTATIAVSNVGNIGWNTMVPNFMKEESFEEELAIDVIKLTDYLNENEVQNIRLIKIDTEGFEFPVMKGLQGYLQKIEDNSLLPIIIIEVAPSAYPKLNSSCAEFAKFMSELGYVPRSIDNVHRVVQVENLDQTIDVLFIPKKIIEEIDASKG